MSRPASKYHILRRSRWLLLLGLLLGNSPSLADVLDGALGLWLQQQAGPELVQELGNHPRFKGETLTLVSLQDGSPTINSNHLTHALEDALTYQLLGQSQIRVQWRQPQHQCGGQKPVPYLLGIELTDLGKDRAQVKIALIDVEENIWVPGINLQWRGTLTRNQQKALRKPLSDATTGSIDRPMLAAQATQISESLLAQIRCALPKGITGPLYVDAGEQQGLAPIAAALHERLARAASFEATTRAEDARWLARLLLTTIPGGNVRLDVVLDETGNRSRQQVASIFVSDLGAKNEPADAGDPAPAVPVVARTQAKATTQQGSNGAITEPNGPLLSELTQSEIAPCRSRQGAACVNVELSVFKPAYLLVFKTENGQVSGYSCADQPKHSDPAERRYRVSIAAERTGLYVLATRDPGIARVLHRHLRRAPGQCGTSQQPMQEWLAALQRLLDRHDGGIEWNAIHLNEGAATKIADR